MDEQILDASAIDGLDDYNLTGDEEDIVTPDPENDTPDPDDDPDNQETPQDNSDDDDFNNSDEDENEDDFIFQVLNLKGIKDPSKIKFEDESGAIIERDWKDLTDNEKLSIFTLEEDTDTDLEEEEISFINMLRENNLTPSKYIELLQEEISKNIQDNQPEVYEVDNLSDDELFALDLIEKLGEDNVTDEELQQALIQAKTNEDLYNKQVKALRTYYKDLENQRNYEKEQEQQAQLEQSYNDFSEKILNQIEGFSEIAGQEIELSVDDKNDIANYILTRDDSGQSDFYKELQDPQILTKAAFWILKGPEIMQDLQNQIKEAYKRGYTLGSSKKSTSTTSTPPQVVITPKQTTTQTQTINNEAIAAIGDDESYLYN